MSTPKATNVNNQIAKVSNRQIDDISRPCDTDVAQ